MNGNINIKKEIAKALKDWRNTNNKEQNFQGHLYAHFLKFKKKGYVVEMETNIKQDKHLGLLFKDKNFDKNILCKSEVDLLLYNEQNGEAYAIELKWIYNREGRWNVVDHLAEFSCDVEFCKQLVENHICTNVCSFVAYDFDDKKQVQRVVFNNDKEDKEAFLGGPYIDKSGKRRKLTRGTIKGVPFHWVDLYDKYRYFMIDGQDILNNNH